jgi:alcohol dehydrogenase
MMGEFFNPVKAIFGPGSFDRIPELIGDRPYAVVTYSEPYFTGLVDRLAQAAGKAAIVIDNVKANPDFPEVEIGCNKLAAMDRLPAVYVGLGGGSAMDTAKALAVSGGDWSLLKEHLESGGARADELHDPCIIAVPTTAGTGSEVSIGAVIWDMANDGKWGVRTPKAYADYAVVDPELTLSLPRDQTVSTALDALSHALESIWTINGNLMTQPIAVQAARDVLEYLPPLADDLGDIVLRTHIANAAMMAGIALSQTRTSIAHQLSYALTMHHGVPHGIACGFSLPMVMQWAIGHDVTCDQGLAMVFGEDLEAGVKRFETFMDDLGVARDPTAYGPSKGQWNRWLADAAAGDKGKTFLGKVPI